MYTKEQFAKLIDYTMLRPTATGYDIIQFCKEARRHHFAAAVVLPFWVPLAAKQLEGSDVKVCTLIGFPHGESMLSAKTYEAKLAASMGAEELDVVINIGAVKSHDMDYVRKELTEIVNTASLSGITTDNRRTLVKVIIETPHLSAEEKATVCRLVADVGADYIMTSTGTMPHGATIEDIQLIRNVVGPTIGVKAAGGIRTTEHALNLLDTGASRLGTSTGVALLRAYDPEELLKTVQR